MDTATRRNFVKSTAGALGAAPALAASRLSPNERVRVALVGLRGRGRDLIKCFGDLDKQNVEIAAFCDCNETVLDERLKGFEQQTGKKPRRITDMRRVLDDKTIHAVAYGTPNHWHALGTVWACQAGKDVYVEKPGTHNISEGRKIIEAAVRYQRIVQHGTQNRTSPNVVEGMRKLKEGVIGRVYLARGVAFKTRPSIGGIENGEPPAGLNWDAWVGPAPKRPYFKNFTRGSVWHLLWDFGNGDIGNQGVHELDMMRWGLGLNTHPDKVVSMGGKYIYKDGQDYPQVQTMMFEWTGKDVLMEFSTRAGFTNTEAGMGAEFPFLDKRNVVGVIFIGTEGYMIFPDYTSYRTFLGPKRTPGPSAVGEGDIATLPHVENFIKAVRSGDPKDLNAGPEELHLSSTMAHLANISQRLGRMVRFDGKQERFIGDAEADVMLTRQYRAPYTL
jgi:predicted dehydrogenase